MKNLSIKSASGILLTALLTIFILVVFKPDNADAYVYEQGVFDRHFFDHRVPTNDGNGGIKIVRITHCDWPGTDCAIGPTVEPCE